MSDPVSAQAQAYGAALMDRVAGQDMIMFAAETAEQSGGTFPPFDTSTFPSQLLWLALSFGVLYYLMSSTIIPRIGGIIEDRRSRIANDLAEADRLRAETDDAIAAYEQELAEAKQKASAIAQKTRDQINAELDEKRAEIDADLAEKAATAAKRIAETRSEAMAEVGGIASDTASAVVEAILGKAPDKSALDAAVKSAVGQ
ncbi:MAG: F0F1 ATP synthase subunit B [Pseudomonadota bacterium]